ncbi:MAG: tetratricopeptide repeat protein [Nostoc sp.]|uniref:tetratricopeptide repeat protein n=1 Tax=unclassified Nostoc TaxID=2593658 RepID=UPI0025E47CC0|nr:tetratricopeptide repeat protein [Nostoc sp. JL34]
MHVSWLNPNNVEAHFNRGLAYYRQGDYQAAMPRLGYAYADNNQVIALKPNDFRAVQDQWVDSTSSHDAQSRHNLLPAFIHHNCY